MPPSVQVSKHDKIIYNEQDDLIVISDSDVEEMGAGAAEKTIPDQDKNIINPEKLKLNVTNYYYDLLIAK